MLALSVFGSSKSSEKIVNSGRPLGAAPVRHDAGFFDPSVAASISAIVVGLSVGAAAVPRHEIWRSGRSVWTELPASTVGARPTRRAEMLAATDGSKNPA